MNEQIVYLDGQYLPMAQARVPVLDRGFIYGDGIYEVVPVYQGVPFRWAEHLARLARSLKKIELAAPLDADGLTGVVGELVRRHPWADQFVYLQVTRGAAPRDHAFPVGVPPTLFAMCSELRLPAPEVIEQGVSTISLPDERWLHCDIKSVSLLGNVLARQAAVTRHCTEAILFRDGFLTEASASNVWIVRNGLLLAPHRDRRILEGVRMGLVDKLTARCGIEFDQRNILREEVFAADEVMLTSATKEVIPVVSIDGRPVGDGRPGPLFRQLWQAYQDEKRDVVAAAAAQGEVR